MFRLKTPDVETGELKLKPYEKILKKAEALERKLKDPSLIRRQELELEREAQMLKENIKHFGKQGQRPVDFSHEQEAMRGMFGHGDTFWNLPNSGCMPTINHDLNPRMRDPRNNSTARLFGFG